jgi:adenine-specific DNA-methyltransferase
VYIDPPYNTDASSILYKNNYKSSSWISLIDSRIKAVSTLMSNNGIICMAIDDEQFSEARHLLASVFDKEIGIAVVRSNPQSRKAKGTFSPVHDYALFYGKSQDSVLGSLEITDKKVERYPYKDSNGRFAWMNFIRTGNDDKREDRPKLYYPIFVSNEDTLRIPEMKWSNNINEYILSETTQAGEIIVFPVVENDGRRVEKRWHRGHERVISEPDEYRVRRSTNGKVSIDFKTRMDEGSTPSTWWDNKDYASANYGALELKELFGEKPFDFPKAKRLVEDCLRASGGGADGTIIDFFAGSGTTGHAIVDMNRKDGAKRNYILVENGTYFDSVTRPRMEKVVYSKDWKDGRPHLRASSTKDLEGHEPFEGISHILKYIRLESYEDALGNLELKRTEQQTSLIDADEELREQYLLSYMLDVETRGSQSLLNVENFRNPDQYKLKVERNGETQYVNVDLVETFNWLLGLTIKHIDVIRGVRVVEGTNPEGELVLVLWRNLDEIDNDALDRWFEKQDYNTRDQEYDLIYVNGDNNLENLRRADQTWKVRLIEEEFQRLMFDVQDV